MPRYAPYALRWQPEVAAYTLTRDGAPVVPEVRADTPEWTSWLDTADSFAFMGADGNTCTVRKEARRCGAAYWWAYKRVGTHMAKRYLGRSAALTVARLCEAAAALATANHGAALAPSLPAPPVAASGSPTLPILATRLQPPQVGMPLLERPHVRERLRRGLDVPLTVLSAPAGFGKTTALADWVGSTREAVAWVSLHPSDNDPTRFWTYVLSALQQAAPGVADAAFAQLGAPPPVRLEGVVNALLNALATRPRPVVLVLDDVQHIVNASILASLTTLFDHPPAPLHLYLAARSTPPLPLARLRVGGRINEIGTDHLRFRPDEVATYLSDLLDIQLPVDELLALAERTDGWAAGVYLAGLSLRTHENPDRVAATFGGSHHHVVAYLAEEVLADQPPEVRRFLLHTSVLDRLCAALCDALTERADAQRMLEHIARANLFLMPLDEEGTWYRYDRLFAEVLRHRLRQEDAALLPELHRRAARWFQAHGAIADAVRHYRAIPDSGAAAQVLADETPHRVVAMPSPVGAPRFDMAPALSASGPVEPLSPRELDVLRLLAHGFSNAEIARHLVIAPSTVKTHTHHIYAKLHTPDRLGAVLRARALGLLER